ncbi:uncharacterized protein TOT_010000368 [Theileria orientalis strain Shintoku]|uniref:Signal peptide containing protein n=1 Tax=Theileria orientalis strain Shintoku TaxID=869250 RepID=J4C2L5_THEOR|nr:uncharacterized protein TOT_010000368 [Theileria orientalis strain Shintoku]BAM38901.1 uncharacterized protein TOT_010000368 [Theileria orientalis strain Shintoku]|eukprot:XP_009689202.1 uncharacterized protein TOT_010000368 [Theileria orientalis strain Shintoku]
MLVKALVLGFLAGSGVLAQQYVGLELNMLDDPAVVSSELDFVNYRVITHDVNPGFYVERVTQSGLQVWKSTKAGHRVTNALMFVNDLGPRLINLTLSVGEGQSQLLMFLYTLQGWVNFNEVNPFNIRVEEHEAEGTSVSPVNLANGEQYFSKDPREKEEKYADEPVVLDLSETVSDKFNYTFKYSVSKYTYDYKPKKGFYVMEIKEGNKKVWSKEKDQLATEIVADKQSDVYVSVRVYYLTSEKPKSLLYVNENGEWKLAENCAENSEEKVGEKGVKKEAVALGEYIKPIARSTQLDYAELPQPPLCRGCTYEIDGITHNVLYFSNDSKFHKFVDGGIAVFDLPNDCVATSSCFYTKNDRTLFVDLVFKKGEETKTKIFEKRAQSYREVTREEFDARLLKFKETPVVLDISKTKKGYTVETTLRNEIEYKFYEPSEGYVVRTVVDGEIKILEVSAYVLEVYVTNLGEDKRLMLILYQNGSFFKFEFYTFYPELGKWTRVSEYFYYKLIEEYSQNMKRRHPSLDISSLTTVPKFMYFSKNEALSHYSFHLRSGVVLSSVLDAGRMVWTPRYPNETCEFVCYNYKAKLLYIVSKADSKVRQYSYVKTGDKWSFITDEEFKKRFAFTYATNLTADIRNNFSTKFTVVENGNTFHITPKSGYLVTRLRYKDRTIWVGSDDLKCTSFFLTYGKYETYLFLDLLDSNMNTTTKYYKTTEGDLLKWRECGKSECRDDARKGLMKRSLSYKSQSETLKSESKSNEEPPVVKLSHLESKLASEGAKASVSLDNVSASPPNLSKLNDKEAMACANEVKVSVASAKEPKEAVKADSDSPMTPCSDEDFLDIEVEDRKTPGTLKMNEQVVKNKVPGAIEYLTGKEMSLPPLRYQERLAIANEPYNDVDLQTSASITIPLKRSSTEAESDEGKYRNKKVKFENDSANVEPDDKVKEDSEFEVLDSKGNLSSASTSIGISRNLSDIDVNNAYDFDNSEAFDFKNTYEQSVYKDYNSDYDYDYEEVNPPKAEGNYSDEAYKAYANEVAKVYAEDVANSNKYADEAYRAYSNQVAGSYAEEAYKAYANELANNNNADNVTTSNGYAEEAYNAYAGETANKVNVYDVDFSKKVTASGPRKVNAFNDLNNPEHLTKLGNFKSVEGVEGKSSFSNGVLFLQDLKSAGFGEFRDAREFGYEYLLFTPYPKHPVTELRDAHEVIWRSHSDQCLAVSVHLRAGFQTMVELFIRTGTEVVRRHFEFSGYRWLPMESEAYDRVCQLDAASKVH